MAMPITMALAIVPNPGICRNGIHSRRTATAVTITTPPKVSGNRLATPKWKTSHGSSPSVPRTIIAIEMP